MKLKRVIMIIAAGLLLLIAVLIVLYPMISNYVNNKYSEARRKAASEYGKTHGIHKSLNVVND